MKMNKIIFLGTLAFLLFLIVSCEKENPNVELIRGLWVNSIVDGNLVLTDYASVIEFKENNIEMFARGSYIDENNEKWEECDDYTYSVKGDVITVNGTDTQGRNVHMECKIISLNNEILTYSVIKFVRDGIEKPDARIYTFNKVTQNLNSQFVGLWFGHCTNQDAADSSYHYWEYFADGTYDYYYQDEDLNWIKKIDNEGRYFLYGNLMASNYTNDLLSGGTGTAYECWNFNIVGNQMTWTGLRENNTSISYQMDKVTSLP